MMNPSIRHPEIRSRLPLRALPKLVERINIHPHDRVLVLGRTGSGKTTFVRALLPAFPRFVIFDAKRTYTMPNVPITPRFDKKLDRQIVRLPLNRLARSEFARWGEEIYKAWESGNRILYVDEVSGVSRAFPPLPELAWAVKTGRERGVGVWAGSQRPKMIPTDLFTESEHIVAFDLQYHADRARVASFTNPEVQRQMDGLKDHSYVYYHVPTNAMRRFAPLSI